MSSDEELSFSSVSHTPAGTPARELSPDITVGEYEKKLVQHGYEVGYKEGKRGGYAVGMRHGLELGEALAKDEMNEKDEKSDKSDDK